MDKGTPRLYDALLDRGLTSGPVYASGLLTGREAAQMIADCKAQESIRQTTARILQDDPTDKLGQYFLHHNIRNRYKITFEQFVERVKAGSWEAYLA